MPVLSIPEFAPFRVEVPSSAFVPALPPVLVLPNTDGFASVDFEEAARQGVRVAELRTVHDKTQPKTRVKRTLGSAEGKSPQDPKQSKARRMKARGGAEGKFPQVPTQPKARVKKAWGGAEGKAPQAPTQPKARAMGGVEQKPSPDEPQAQKRGKKALNSAERFSRPLGIIGWTALDKFQHVKASPLHLWIKSDRYPQLGGTSSFTPAVPVLKALLPVKLSSALPHSLTYLECGYINPSLPLDRCRVLLPNLSSWQCHQFLCHALGFLCTECHIWLETEPALQAHALECEQQKGE